MGLPAAEQRVLDTIENELRISDQQLATAFAAFTKFAQGTRMPRPERLTAWRRLITRMRRRRLGLLRPVLDRKSPTQDHALGGDHATPHAVLADISVSKRQREALGAHWDYGEKARTAGPRGSWRRAGWGGPGQSEICRVSNNP
jgi:hypothetical protein